MSIISAGTSNTTSLVYTGDTTGAMVFQTNGTTEAMRIDTSQNAFVGTTTFPVLGYEKLGVNGTGAFRSTGATALGLWNTTNAGLIQFYTEGGGTGAGSIQATGAALNVIGGSSLSLSATGANPITFGTNSTERMRIDSSGRVTMPYQPAFHAVRTGGNVSSTGIFICNTVTYNDGNHYNSSTGIFTAPVTGRYQMNFFVLAQNGNSFDFAIRVGGVQYAGMDIRCNSATSGNFTLSCSAILKLVANDTVDPFISYYGSGPVYGQGLNAFSMCFLG